MSFVTNIAFSNCFFENFHTTFMLPMYNLGNIQNKALKRKKKLRKKVWRKFRFRQQKFRHRYRYRNLILVSVADTETRFRSYTIPNTKHRLFHTSGAPASGRFDQSQCSATKLYILNTYIKLNLKKALIIITEDGSTEALLQILYGQYLILGEFGSCMFQT